jgi:ABC-type phosphate transport system substrate-binding protein
MKPWLAAVFVLAVVSMGFAQKPRVYITDSTSWEVHSAAGASGGNLGASGSGGARPQTAEIIKTFNERCPSVIINSKKEKADYVILLDHEGGKSLIDRDNKVVVFNRDGDAILSRSTRSLGNAVKDACTAVEGDWPHQKARVQQESEQHTSTAKN